MQHSRLLALGLTLTFGFVACKAKPKNTSLDEAPAFPADRNAYYKKAFAEADTFSTKEISPSLVRSANKGNTSYVVARKGDDILGYIRDIQAPVSLSASCPCAPLSLSLVFDGEYQFLNLISPAPLRKKGRVAMTDEDRRRLVEIIKEPSESLREVKYVEDVVDAKTGATKKSLVGHVVSDAAYSTQRILGIVSDTQAVLQKAPLSNDEKLLKQAYGDGQVDPMPAFERVYPKLESTAARVQVWTNLLHNETHKDKPREAQLRAWLDVPPHPRPEQRAAARAEFAYELAGKNHALSVVESLLQELSKPEASVHPAVLNRIAGTLAFQKKDYQSAQKRLSVAVKSISVEQDPDLHARYAESVTMSSSEQGCEAWQKVVGAHPKYPGALEALRGSCAKKGRALLKSLSSKRKKRVLSGRLGGLVAPSLNVESQGGQNVLLDFSKRESPTVLVFFATWCPHCQKEMPTLNALHQRLLGSKLGQIEAVRTSLDRETEEFGTFVERFGPKFPIYNDVAMSLTFSKFSNDLGIPPGLPTIVVIGTQGRVEYLVDGGSYNDTQQEIIWMLESLKEKQ